MAEVSVSRALPTPAQNVWELIGNFGDISWMPAGTPVELEGSGPGMVRVIGAGDQKIREVLEICDPEQRTLTYTIGKGVPFPVTDYRSTMSVKETSEGCELEWGCRFEPDGVTEAEAGNAIKQMYAVMIGWVAERAAKA